MKSRLKNLVRARMEKTGESHQRALRTIRAQAAPSSSEERVVRSRVVADTAFPIAVVRAEEQQRPERERLFEDPYAHLFSPEGEETIESTQRFLRLPFFHDGIRLRTRFIDDVVRGGLASGLDQVVLLGAGFDTRAHRMAELRARRARVYEVDTADQLARKRRRLTRAGVTIPRSIRYVPFDFAARDIEPALGDALRARGFVRGAGALFVWEGVIGYITQEEIDASLRFMAREGGRGSLVVFTFGDSAFEPETASAHVIRAGFSHWDEHDGEALWRRYMKSEPHPHASLMKIGVATV